MNLEECCICLCNTQESYESMITLECGHSYHFVCLYTFFSNTDFYFNKCCCCTKELTKNDLNELYSFYYNFQSLREKCKYGKLEYKDSIEFNINTNNSQLLLDCIISNNIYNLNFLLLHKINVDNNVIDNMIEYSIIYNNFYIFNFIINEFNIISLNNINIYLMCIQYNHYDLLSKIINTISQNPDLSKTDLLYKSIIDNDYLTFIHFKNYLNNFNINHLNSAIYFSIKNNNIFMLKDIIYFCNTSGIKYKNIVQETCKKLNCGLITKYIVSLI